MGGESTQNPKSRREKEKTNNCAHHLWTNKGGLQKKLKNKEPHGGPIQVGEEKKPQGGGGPIPGARGTCSTIWNSGKMGGGKKKLAGEGNLFANGILC